MVLWLCWCLSPNTFTFLTYIEETTVLIKRIILSRAAKLFDPLGIVIPIIVVPKGILKH